MEKRVRVRGASGYPNSLKEMTDHCGSEPARDDDGTCSINVTDKPLSRAGSLPQGFV